MSAIDDDADDELARQLGRALMEWSRVEHLWANIFRDLLFDGIGAPSAVDPETKERIPGADAMEKNDRADALFFSHKNSSAQLNLLEAVGCVTLAKRALLLGEFKDVLKATRRLAGTRNTIIHAYYDGGLVVGDSSVELTPIRMISLGRFKKAPDVNVLSETTKFEKHADEVYEFWSRLGAPT